jgi:galactokinase
MSLNLFEGSPVVVASAPGRANLLGEHVDYAGGVVLPFAISYRTQVGITPRADKIIRVRSAQSSEEIELQWSEVANWQGPTWARYVIGVLHTLGRDLPGLDIQVDGSVPQGSGLSSSAALECAVATALNELFTLGLSPLELAKIAKQTENEYVGMPCGLMDQAASMLSRADSILQFDCLSLETDYLPFNLHKQDLSILIIDSCVKHELVDGGYANRFKACETARTSLGLESLRYLTPELFESADLDPLVRKRVSHIVGEIERVGLTIDALKRDDFEAVGQYMTKTHASLRDLFEISWEEMDLAVEVGMENGALGARMMGGGFGGSGIFLVPKANEQQIVEAVAEAFAKKGYVAPKSFIAEPSAGARVEA